MSELNPDPLTPADWDAYWQAIDDRRPSRLRRFLTWLRDAWLYIE